MTCSTEPDTAGAGGETHWTGTFVNGEVHTDTLVIRISPALMGNSDDSRILHTMLHGIGHARYLDATPQQQATARVVLGATEYGWSARSYYNRPEESAAHAAAVCYGGAPWWGYRPITCAQADAIYAALR